MVWNRKKVTRKIVKPKFRNISGPECMSVPEFIYLLFTINDRLCGLVGRVSGYRFRGPGFDSRPYQIFWEIGGLERGPLSLVRNYLNEKVAAPV
jgi:hypothetical protein